MFVVKMSNTCDGYGVGPPFIWRMGGSLALLWTPQLGLFLLFSGGPSYSIKHSEGGFLRNLTFVHASESHLMMTIFDD